MVDGKTPIFFKTAEGRGRGEDTPRGILTGNKKAPSTKDLIESLAFWD